jgi:hypothetical protein
LFIQFALARVWFGPWQCDVGMAPVAHGVHLAHLVRKQLVLGFLAPAQFALVLSPLGGFALGAAAGFTGGLPPRTEVGQAAQFHSKPRSAKYVEHNIVR